MNTRAPWVAGLLLLAAVAAVIVFTTPWDPFGSLTVDPIPPDVDRDFTAAEQAIGNDFASDIRPPALLNLALGLLAALLLGFTRAGANIVGALGRMVGGRWYGQVALGAIALVLVVRLVTLPLAAWAESIRQDRGLSTRGWGEWLLDVARSVGVTSAGTVVGLLILVALARMLPRLWWAVGAALAAGLVVLASFVYPLIVEPVFNEFSPMADSELRTTLIDMAARDGVPVEDVLVADASRRTTTLNAYVSGFGATRRIVVYDTLLDAASDSEVQSVVAHEIGHVSENDVRNGTLIGAFGAAGAVCLLAGLLRRPGILRRAGTDGPADPRVIALVLALVAVGSFVATPVQNLVSRQIEARADVHALELTRDPASFIELQRSLALTALRDVDPPSLLHVVFGTHPTTPERIALARTWEQLEDQ